MLSRNSQFVALVPLTLIACSAAAANWEIDPRVQAGYRWTTLGIEMPVSNGPMVALWRTF